MLGVREIWAIQSSVTEDSILLGHYPEIFLPEFRRIIFPSLSGSRSPSRSTLQGPIRVTRIVIPDLCYCFQVASYRTLFFSCLLLPASRIWQLRYCTLFPARWSVNTSQFCTRTLSLSFNTTSAVDQFMTLTNIMDHITPRPVFSLTGSHTQHSDTADRNKTS